MVEKIAAVRFTAKFRKQYQRLPEPVRQKFNRQLMNLLENPGYPSLRLKKIQGTADVWEGSVTMNYRFTFCLVETTATFRTIGTHDILKKT